MSESQKNIGQMLFTVGLSVAGATAAFLVQYGALQARLVVVEAHLTAFPHPPTDFRALMEHRDKNMLERIERHERVFNHHTD